MTKLGEHIKISGNGPNVFNKRKIWDKAGDVLKSQKPNKKEQIQNPTVYFSMFILSEVDPTDIIERTTHEWARMNGTRLQIKELQFVESKTVVSFYKVSKLTPREVILVEMKKILLMAQDKARQDGLDHGLYDFTLDLDVESTESLPDMTLRVQTAKLKGEDVSTFNRLSNRTQYARKTWHLEVPSMYATKIKGLVEIAKTYKCVEAYWGIHAHLSEVTNLKSTATKANTQVELTQKYTNYEVSMTADNLDGVIDLGYESEICHPTTGKLVGLYSLCHVLLNFVKIGDRRPAITEAHQSDIAKPTYLIVPNTPKAERMIGMMNKNLPAYLYHTLLDFGLPEDFIEDLLQHSCEAMMLAERHCCKWDKENRTLTTADDEIQAEKAMAFDGAAWFKDKFGLLGKNSIKNSTHYAALEALFNLDDAGPRKTINDCHKKVQTKEGATAAVGTPPRSGTKMQLVDMTTTDGDFASHTSSSSNKGTNLSNKGSRSKSSGSDEDDSMSAAGSG